MHIDNDGLKKMAAEAIVSHKASGDHLNKVITKLAMDNSMNSDQVKRLVETTNQVAYLSQLENEDDRTFEFDVAEYPEIMNQIIGAPEIEKAASVAAKPMSLVTDAFAEPMEKVATEKEATLEKWGKGRKMQALKKVAAQERTRLDSLKAAEHDNLVKLASHREKIIRDPEALEKMAKFDNQMDMTKLVFGHEKAAQDVRWVWGEDDMSAIKDLSEDMKMIKAAQAEIAELEPKVLSAEAMIKEAVFGSIAKSVSTNYAKGKAKGKAAQGAAKAAAGGVKSYVDKEYGRGKKLAGRAMKAGELAEGATSVKKRSVKRDVWSNLRG